MPNVDIREAIAADYESVCRLFAEGDEFHRRFIPHIFRKPSGPARESEYFLGLVDDENSALLLAESDGQAIGLVHVLMRESSPIPIMVPRRFAIIDSVVVSERFRRAGIGRLLMEHAHSWALSRGVDTVELNVWEFNEGAIALYEELGYVTDRRHMSIRLTGGSDRGAT